MSEITLKGNPIHTSGELPALGTTAPAFTLVNQDLERITLDSYRGQRKLLSILPSFDTPTCTLSNRYFAAYAKAHPGTTVIVISADLPFAQSRFCNAENIDNLIPLSTMGNAEPFGHAYGVLCEDGPLAGITARAVLVLDEENRVLHRELVAELSDEPNYKAALAALTA